ncbi:hypothetical protein JKP88DRAFT_313076 [Tribonema minus]|uniref:WW domain-containing protein n=1 Tax=Tribonema minus TaxID=303371 RepID=A0A836CGZ8_9STRA|nr:hypothetical protein JKP88DRAFT_313076 [Tribonema minus]
MDDSGDAPGLRDGKVQGDWTSYWDESSSQYYFYNTGSGETVWTAPPEFEEDAAVTASQQQPSAEPAAEDAEQPFAQRTPSPAAPEDEYQPPASPLADEAADEGDAAEQWAAAAAADTAADYEGSPSPMDDGEGSDFGGFDAEADELEGPPWIEVAQPGKAPYWVHSITDETVATMPEELRQWREAQDAAAVAEADAGAVSPPSSPTVAAAAADGDYVVPPSQLLAPPPAIARYGDDGGSSSARARARSASGDAFAAADAAPPQPSPAAGATDAATAAAAAAAAPTPHKRAREAAAPSDAGGGGAAAAPPAAKKAKRPARTLESWRAEMRRLEAELKAPDAVMDPRAYDRVQRYAAAALNVAELEQAAEAAAAAAAEGGGAAAAAAATRSDAGRVAQRAASNRAYGLLLNSYVGYAQYAALASDWLRSVEGGDDGNMASADDDTADAIANGGSGGGGGGGGDDPDAIVSGIVERALADAFDVARADALLDSDADFARLNRSLMPALLRAPRARAAVVRLFNAHRESALLRHLLRRLSAAGFHGEIAGAVEVADIFEVFAATLQHTLGQVPTADSTQLLVALLPSLRRLCCATDYMFAFSQEALRRLEARAAAAAAAAPPGDAAAAAPTDACRRLSALCARKFRRLRQELAGYALTHERDSAGGDAVFLLGGGHGGDGGGGGGTQGGGDGGGAANGTSAVGGSGSNGAGSGAAGGGGAAGLLHERWADARRAAMAIMEYATRRHLPAVPADAVLTLARCFHMEPLMEWLGGDADAAECAWTGGGGAPDVDLVRYPRVMEELVDCVFCSGRRSPNREVRRGACAAAPPPRSPPPTHGSARARVARRLRAPRVRCDGARRALLLLLLLLLPLTPPRSPPPARVRRGACALLAFAATAECGAAETLRTARAVYSAAKLCALDSRFAQQGREQLRAYVKEFPIISAAALAWAMSQVATPAVTGTALYLTMAPLFLELCEIAIEWHPLQRPTVQGLLRDMLRVIRREEKGGVEASIKIKRQVLDRMVDMMRGGYVVHVLAQFADGLDGPARLDLSLVRYFLAEVVRGALPRRDAGQPYRYATAGAGAGAAEEAARAIASDFLTAGPQVRAPPPEQRTPSHLPSPHSGADAVYVQAMRRLLAHTRVQAAVLHPHFDQDARAALAQFLRHCLAAAAAAPPVPGAARDQLAALLARLKVN